MAIRKREQLVELLETMIEHIKANESFEGAVTYNCMHELCTEQDDFEVSAFVRTKNTVGQGGGILITGIF